MDFSITHVKHEQALDYLRSINRDNPPSPKELSEQLLTTINEEILSINATMAKGETKHKLLRLLEPPELAEIVKHLYSVKLISWTDNPQDSNPMLAVYCEDGLNKGIYVEADQYLPKVLLQYNHELTEREMKNIYFILKAELPIESICRNKNLVAVNNGIFDYQKKLLLPFSPDYIFMSKSRVNFNIKAKNVTIHNPEDNTDWDVESWMNSLSDDPAIVALLWQVLGAIIRPNVRWNKSVWLYSEQGNNGKGTLCELMRNLLGQGTYAAIPISSFAKEFMLEPLIKASAIIVDENNVGGFVDSLANFKAVVTNDVIQLNRKHKAPIDFQFRGLVVECINDLPKIKDKSDSFLRRLLFVPMTKCFTGKERPYIKNDYLHRQVVLEYVLKKVLLDTNFYQLSEPDACVMLLNTYRVYNNPTEDFWFEFKDRFQWDMLPYDFLYELYKAYIRETNPHSSVSGKNTFLKDLRAVILRDRNWVDVPNSRKRGNHMMEFEPLINEFNLTKMRDSSLHFNYTPGINFILPDEAKEKTFRCFIRA